MRLRGKKDNKSKLLLHRIELKSTIIFAAKEHRTHAEMYELAIQAVCDEIKNGLGPDEYSIEEVKGEIDLFTEETYWDNNSLPWGENEHNQTIGQILDNNNGKR